MEHIATLHGHRVSQPVRAVMWFMRNNNISGVEFKQVDLFQQMEHLQESFTAKTPYQQVPVLELADGRVLTESGAIMNFLAVSQGQLREYPTNDPFLLSKIHEAQIHHPTLARTATIRIWRPFRIAKMKDPATCPDVIQQQILHFRDEIADAFWTLNHVLHRAGPDGYITGSPIFTVADYNVVVELNQLELISDYVPREFHVFDEATSTYPYIARYLNKVRMEVPGFDEFRQPTVEFVAPFLRNVPSSPQVLEGGH